MKVKRVIRRRLRNSDGGVKMVADLNVAVAANVSEPYGSETLAASHRVTEIAQRGRSGSRRRQAARPGNRS